MGGADPIEDVPVDLVEAAAHVEEARESDGGATPTAGEHGPRQPQESTRRRGHARPRSARRRGHTRPRRARDGGATPGRRARDGKEPTGGKALGKRNGKSARESKVNPRT
jgi:hypothetical protein